MMAINPMGPMGLLSDGRPLNGTNTSDEANEAKG